MNPKTTASDADIDAAVLAAEPACPACEGLTARHGLTCCWNCGRTLPQAPLQALPSAALWSLCHWLSSGHTGKSSLALVNALLGNWDRISSSDYPRDIGDLARCLGLIEQVPEMRRAVGLLAARPGFEVWAALALAWDELTALAVQDDRETQRRLYELRRAAEPQPQTVGERLGQRIVLIERGEVVE